MLRPSRLAIGVALGLTIVLAAPARAAVESDLVKAGMAAYDELDYTKSIDLLRKALRETLTREEIVLTYRTLAFAHVAVDKPAEAQGDFENLLRVDPSFQLDRTISPRVRSVFEVAQAKVATAGLPSTDFRSQLHPEVGPRDPKEGQPINIRLNYPGALANKMVLYYRTRGQNRFSRISERALGGLFSTTIPGMQVAAPGFEYYVIVVDATGSGIAAAGSLGQPLTVDVRGKPRSIAKSPAFWGGLAAGVVVIGVVAGVLAATLPSHVGPETAATLTVKPQWPQ